MTSCCSLPCTFLLSVEQVPEYNRVAAAADDRFFLEHGELLDARVSPAGTSPQASDKENASPPLLDRPVPGVIIAPDELLRQQHELIRLQLATAEVRPQSVPGMPLARMLTGSSDIMMRDAVSLRDYVPMEVDRSLAPSPAPSVRHPAHSADGARLLRPLDAPRAPLVDVGPVPLLPPPMTAFTDPSLGPVPIASALSLHFDDPDAVYRGLAPERVQLARAQLPTSIVILHIYNGGAPRANNIKEQSDTLTEGLHQIVPGDCNFIVVPPAAEYGAQLSSQDQPTAWLVLRLTPPQSHYLLSGKHWTSRGISFTVHSPDPYFGGFLGRVGYYTHNVDGDIVRSIRRAFAGPLIRPSIRALVAARPGIQAEDIDVITDHIVDDIRVDVITYPNTHIAANVFCAPPTYSVADYHVWAEYVRSIPIWSDLNPISNFLRPVRCGGCAAADHPTFLCPFPLLPGWLGPAAGAPTIAGPVALLIPTPPVGTGYGRGTPPNRGGHPYRGGNVRARRGRGRAPPPF